MAVTDRIGEPILYLARHAEVKRDKEGRMRGLLNDSLDEDGERQAQELAELFNDKYVAAGFTDDLDRTKQTLQPIAAAKDFHMGVDTELRSWDVGSDLEGRSIEANKDTIRMLKSQPDTIPVGGQSWRSYVEQTKRAFSHYWTMALESGPILLVLHGSSIQVIWEMLGAMAFSTAYDQTPLEPGGVASVYLAREGPRIKVLRGAKETADA